jgi:hypothetical protein
MEINLVDPIESDDVTIKAAEAAIKAITSKFGGPVSINFIGHEMIKAFNRIVINHKEGPKTIVLRNKNELLKITNFEENSDDRLRHEVLLQTILEQDPDMTLDMLKNILVLGKYAVEEIQTDEKKAKEREYLLELSMYDPDLAPEDLPILLLAGQRALINISVLMETFEGRDVNLAANAAVKLGAKSHLSRLGLPPDILDLMNELKEKLDPDNTKH